MTFPVNVTVVLRILPDGYMAWLKRELYSNSCGHTSCNTCTLTLFVSNIEAPCASNTVHKVISLYGDLKHCIGSPGRVHSANTVLAHQVVFIQQTTNGKSAGNLCI